MFDIRDYYSYLFGGPTFIDIINDTSDYSNLNTFIGMDSPSLPDFFGGTDGIDVIFGNAGDDTLFGGAGNDLINSGSGGTPISAGDLVDGGFGIDTASYIGGAGITVDLDNNGGAVYVPTVGGPPQVGDGFISGSSTARDELRNIENIVGSSFADSITGNDGANVLIGGDGDDVLIGEGGDDILIGGAGSDVIDGGAGNDTASYAGSESNVFVNLNNDGYADNIGEDELKDGEVRGGDGTSDTLISIENLDGSDHDDWLFGNDSNNIIAGGAGRDILWGEGGDDYLFGGADRDKLVGGDGVDTLYGGDGNDILRGQAGQDTLFGDDGNDRLIGNGGGDYLGGGDGDDRLKGGNGRDILDGGDGADTFIFQINGGTDRVLDFETGVDVIDLSRVVAGRVDWREIFNSLSERLGDTTVDLSEYGTKIILNDVTISELSADDFYFA